jgi:hypothetical protein
MDRFTYFKGLVCFSSEENPWKFFQFSPNLKLDRSEVTGLCHAGVMINMVPNAFDCEALPRHLPLFSEHHPFPENSSGTSRGFLCHDNDIWSFEQVCELSQGLNAIFTGENSVDHGMVHDVHAFLFEVLTS